MFSFVWIISYIVVLSFILWSSSIRQLEIIVLIWKCWIKLIISISQILVMYLRGWLVEDNLFMMIPAESWKKYVILLSSILCSWWNNNLCIIRIFQIRCSTRRSNRSTPENLWWPYLNWRDQFWLKLVLAKTFECILLCIEASYFVDNDKAAEG